MGILEEEVCAVRNAQMRSNQSMKPTPPFRYNPNVFATTPCRGFTQGAINFARGKPILFLDTDDLIAMQEGRDVTAGGA